MRASTASRTRTSAATCPASFCGAPASATASVSARRPAGATRCSRARSTTARRTCATPAACSATRGTGAADGCSSPRWASAWPTTRSTATGASSTSPGEPARSGARGCARPWRAATATRRATRAGTRPHRSRSGCGSSEGLREIALESHVHEVRAQACEARLLERRPPEVDPVVHHVEHQVPVPVTRIHVQPDAHRAVGVVDDLAREAHPPALRQQAGARVVVVDPGEDLLVGDRVVDALLLLLDDRRAVHADAGVVEVVLVPVAVHQEHAVGGVPVGRGAQVVLVDPEVHLLAEVAPLAAGHEAEQA